MNTFLFGGKILSSSVCHCIQVKLHIIKTTINPDIIIYCRIFISTKNNLFCHSMLFYLSVNHTIVDYCTNAVNYVYTEYQHFCYAEMLNLPSITQILLLNNKSMSIHPSQHEQSKTFHVKLWHG